MFGMAVPWAAMGIGALMGGLSSKQSGGNFLKGALQGAALGGVGGMLGGSYGKFGGTGGAGGIFGLGKKMLPNFLAMSGFGMGVEMMGQQGANKRRMEQTRRWLDEEEERRIARLSKIAGYDVADPANFMNPNKYFGSARGGYKTRPHYQLGGPTSMEDDPANAANIQPLQMDPGTMGPGQLTEEFDYMDEASLNPEIQKLYRAFLVANQATEEEVPVEMFMQLMQQQGGGQQGTMMAAEGGSVMGKDEYDEELNRPNMFLGGALGIGALLGGAGLLSKLLGRKKDVRAKIKEKPIFKPFPKPGPHPWMPGDDEDDMENFPILLNNQLALGAAKGGGIGDLDLRGGGASNGPGTGTSDDIPAMLSDGEFVVTANAVQNLGGGDRMLGAQRMYRMMNQLDPNSQTPAEMSGVGYA